MRENPFQKGKRKAKKIRICGIIQKALFHFHILHNVTIPFAPKSIGTYVLRLPQILLPVRAVKTLLSMSCGGEL
jgi:hypothetical protein